MQKAVMIEPERPWRQKGATAWKVRDGADSYLIEDGKIVAQTIHYMVEQK
jgi:hypothetical protein